MFLKDAPHVPLERPTSMPELLEDYKAQRVRLIAQTRELERLRHQVRSSAEREAAAIVTAARRNVRQVLLDARHELLVLVAQLQAVGCDSPARELPQNIFPSEATSSSTITTAVSSTSEPVAGGDIVSGARRDVREVLLEAQSELVALAEEARELRARIARQHSHTQELPAAPLEVSSTVTLPPEPLTAAAPHASDAEAVSFNASRESALDGAPVEYTPLSSTPRVWAAVAAAVAFVAVGVTLFLSAGGRAGSPGAPQALRSGQSPRSSEPSARPAAGASAAPVATTPDPSLLSLTIDVRRPAWIRTTVDGRGDVGRLFNAGEKRTVTARDAVVMRTGDAGAVFVSVNGGAARALGLDGRVITRRFGNPATATAQKPAVLQAAAESEPDVDPAPSGAPAAIETTPSDVGTTGTTQTMPVPRVAAVEREILRATQQWFEAYFAGNAEAMRSIATPDFAMVDERGDGQRFPATQRAVDRGLQQVRIEVAGDAAVISARLTERANVNGQLREYVSLVSGVWVRADGSWRLMGVRFMDPAKIGA